MVVPLHKGSISHGSIRQLALHHPDFSSLYRPQSPGSLSTASSVPKATRILAHQNYGTVACQKMWELISARLHMMPTISKHAPFLVIATSDIQPLGPTQRVTCSPGDGTTAPSPHDSAGLKTNNIESSPNLTKVSLRTSQHHGLLTLPPVFLPAGRCRRPIFSPFVSITPRERC